MSARYRPDEDAIPPSPWTTVDLANRDLSVYLPINFVTHPGVSLTAACFHDGVFEDSRVELCISNLLAARFRRFTIDIFWHPDARQFRLCPVSEGGSDSPDSVSAGPTETGSRPSTLTVSASSAVPTNSESSVRLLERQNTSPTSSTSGGVMSSPASSSTTAASSAAADVDDEDVRQIGSYRCTSTVDLTFLTALFNDYFEETTTILMAEPLYLIFNLHVASSSGQQGISLRLSQDQLPKGEELLGARFEAESADPPYRPSELFTERRKIPEFWAESFQSQPFNSTYFDQDSTSGGQSTRDGWPNEDFLVFKQYRRMLLGWGTIDPQMEGYNFEADSGTVFSPNYIAQKADVELDKDGEVIKGCFYDRESTQIQQRNSSWAVAAVQSTPLRPGSLTSCGISPLLNATLDVSADVDPRPYVSFMQSTIWSWAGGEPRNASQIGDDDLQQQFRCALFSTHPDTAVNRWQVENCPTSHRAACRVDHEPYTWRLTSMAIPFEEAEAACNASGAAFAVPRTGLENQFLLEYIRSRISDDKGLTEKGAGVWLNFNSLDAEQCWVSGGVNATCPYFDNDQAVQQRTVIVPVVASLVVIFLAALTLFVKCNKNRRNSRRRVRGEGGWDYEGVPS